MDALLDQARAVWEGQIDFKGQHLVELLSTLLLTTSGILAFIIGYFTQNIHNTLWIGLGGTALTFVVCVPPWPFYNRDPVVWLKGSRVGKKGRGGDAVSARGFTGGQGLEGIQITVDGRDVQ